MAHAVLAPGRVSPLGPASLAIGVIVWCVEIFTPIIGFGVLGVPWNSAPHQVLDPSAGITWGTFTIAIIMAFGGLAAIIGFVVGLIGTTTSGESHEPAVIGATLNGVAWVAVMIAFVAQYGS
ncbi:MAG: hypothetical protein P8K80_08210 [Phycisphaerales bacterium]|nr:hypothetical protein [Phycisphaerales bacterium]